MEEGSKELRFLTSILAEESEAHATPICNLPDQVGLPIAPDTNIGSREDA